MPTYETHEIKAGGCHTRYVEAGAGQPLLLLHSMDPGNSGALEFRENIEPLSRHFRVIAPDLMGFAGTSLPEGGVRDINESYVEHIVGLIDALGLEKISLVGNSRGGIISIAIADAYPAQVERVVLLANAGGAPSQEYMTEMGKRFGGFKPTREMMRTFLSNSYFAIDRSMTPAMFDEYCANALVQYARYAAVVGGLPNNVPDMRPHLARATHPFLYIFGTDDNLWPPVHVGVDTFLTTPGARYYLIHDCGHHPQTEAAPEVNLLMTAFLTGKMDR